MTVAQQLIPESWNHDLSFWKPEYRNIGDFSQIPLPRFQLIMEGIWSNVTHPKDFPFSVWLTHFSDLIGASHVPSFSFWGKDHVATDGFRQLAEWGSASGVETELRANSNKLRTLIKAAGLWYPNVNSNTTTNFRQDILCSHEPRRSPVEFFLQKKEWQF